MMTSDSDRVIMPERIVCAANKYPSGEIILGTRHYDQFMHSSILSLASTDSGASDSVIQGFVSNRGMFYNRQEAWVIAMNNNQVIRRVGGDDSQGGTLYSENLY